MAVTASACKPRSCPRQLPACSPRPRLGPTSASQHAVWRHVHPGALAGAWRGLATEGGGRRSKGQGPRAALTAVLCGPLSECGGHDVPWKSTHFPQGQFPWAVAWTHISYLRGIPIGPFGVTCRPWTHHDGQRPASVRCPSSSALDPEFPRGKAEGDWTVGRQSQQMSLPSAVIASPRLHGTEDKSR